MIRRGRSRDRRPVGAAHAAGSWLALGLCLAVVGTGLGAQEPGAGDGPAVRAVLGADSARVGDVVPLAIRVTTGPGERVVWPDTLPLAGSELENAARVTERVDTLDGGRLSRTGVYALTPWRTGTLTVPALTVSLVSGDESPRRIRVVGPTLAVASVLPADTTGLEPKPAKAVVGPSWAWGTMALLALLLAAAAAALAWWWRSRRGGEEAAVRVAPLVPPRERALAALQEAREAGLVERGEMKEFYTLVSDAVRHYVAALEGAWGEDLTTTELLGRFRAHVGPSEAVSLREVLAPADQVKFARREPDPETAMDEWEAARSWIVGFDWPPRRVAPAEEAA